MIPRTSCTPSTLASSSPTKSHFRHVAFEVVEVAPAARPSLSSSEIGPRQGSMATNAGRLLFGVNLKVNRDLLAERPMDAMQVRARVALPSLPLLLCIKPMLLLVLT